VTRQHQSVTESKSQNACVEEPPSDLPKILGSATLIYQMIANLLSNALKFSPVGGDLLLQLMAPRPGFVGLAVRDNSPGVPLAERVQLFVENAQRSPRPTVNEKSHGFGLAAAKKLAEQIGGTVGADFPATDGSVVWCDLPGA
jgi:signal transduction histidine kinase